MRTERGVHDNNVYAYSVDCAGQRLVLHTAFRDSQPHELTDVIFRGVVAHHFEHVLPGNILFSVEEVDLATLVWENAGRFAESWRFGWPPVEYDGALEALIQGLQASSTRAFAIASSYGLSGWVLAADCEEVPRAEPATVA